MVKVNLYNTMGTLATVMDDEQLDLLFKKFEGSSSQPLPDTLRLFELLQRLVASDSRVGQPPAHTFPWCSGLYLPSVQNLTGVVEVCSARGQKLLHLKEILQRQPTA